MSVVPNSMPDYTATLEIAGLRARLAISGIGPVLATALRAKYRLFERDKVTSGGGYDFNIAASFEASVNTSVAERPVPLVRPHGQHIMISQRLVDAQLDAANGRVMARLGGTTLHPVENLLRLLWSWRLPGLGGALFHSAGIVHGGHAWLFPGQSEAGKTTLSLRAGRERTLSDEMPAVRPGGAGWQLYATPFWGEMGHGDVNTSAPLRAIVLLAGKDERWVRPATRAEATQRLLSTVFCYAADVPARAATRDVCEKLVMSLPLLAVATEKDEPFESVMTRINTALPDVAR